MLSNIYLHVLDVLWTRVRGILARLGVELHPDKTGRVVLYDGKRGFDCQRLESLRVERKGRELGPGEDGLNGGLAYRHSRVAES